jgi:eukaryotic-like serine/threonine-protein kinase
MFTTDALSAALADRYAIERLIGEGGMAKVYLARDLRHHRRVALKVLRPDLGAVVGIDRFQAEIQVTANLQHPNLLPLFDSGVAGELLFYVMPYIEGESLRARLDREKQLPVDEAIRIATAIAGALDYAHRQGVVHRDLKPENILIQEGQPLVADFGIALAISNAGGARITQTGLSLGTPQYMSPEQASGDRAIDGRTDIYSLGALTYEMLTGEPPHVGSTSQAIIARVLTERPRSIRATRPSVPEHVEATVSQALEKLPADRWGTARDFAEALTGTRSVARSTAALTSARAIPVSRASRIREAAAWTLVVALGATTAYVLVRANHPAAAPVSAEFEVAVPDGVDITGTGPASSIALSRDGRTLVFVGRRGDGQTMLYSRRLSERFVQEIRGTEGARSPVFSPDGSELLFAMGTGGETTIQRIPIGGGVARTFSDIGPGNGQISWRERDQVVMALGGPGQPHGLWLVNPESHSRTLLAPFDTVGGEQYGFPDVLPGGKAALIAIGKGRTGVSVDSAVLAVVSIPDGKVKKLGVYGLFPRYSPTGQLIYATAAGQLYAVPFDARTSRVSLGSQTLLAERVNVGPGGAARFAVADNGTLAYVPARIPAGFVQPVIVDRAGVQRSIGVARGFYRNPRISPDGRQVVFSIAEAAGDRNPDIWRLDVATGRPARVTTNRASDRPVWSRDGNEIFFSSVPETPVEYSISLTASAQPKVLFRGPSALVTSDFGPAHGYAVVGVVGPKGFDLWVAPMDSLDKARVLMAEPYVEVVPRISPDGRFVAYESQRTGKMEIYVRQIVGGGEEVKVSRDGGWDPAWSHDGHELFFRSDVASTGSMMAAQVTIAPTLAASNVRVLFPLTNFYSSHRTTYDVFPNGDFLMLAEQGDTTKLSRAPLVVRLNWASALQDRAAAQNP